MVIAPSAVKKLLLVEDDLLMTRMYQRKFARDGYDVKSATDGQEGINALTGGFKPDIILLDIMMPRLNGFQVLEQIKGNSEWQKIPVIVLTNLTDDPATIQKTLDLGATSYLVKSDVSMEEVAKRVEDTLKASHL